MSTEVAAIELAMPVARKASVVKGATFDSGPRRGEEHGLRNVCFRFGARYLSQAILSGAPLLLADVVALRLASLGAMLLFSGAGIISGDANLSLWGWHSLFMQPLIGAALGLYPGVSLSALAEFRLSAVATTAWIAILAIVMLSIGGSPLAVWPALLVTWALAFCFVPFFRSVVRALCSRTSWWCQPAIVFGNGAEAAKVFRRLRETPCRGLMPVGIIGDLRLQQSDRFVEPAWYLGPPSAARSIAERHGVFWGVVALGEGSQDDMTALLDRHAAAIPHLLVLREPREDLRSWEGAHDCGGLIGFRIDERLLLPLPRLVKRLMDVLITLVGGLLMLPVLILIALAIKLTSRGPIFYSQPRVGRGGEEFRAWKFRSMVPNAAEVLENHLAKHPSARLEWSRFQKLRHDPRVTRVGRVLRKASLDELPQLWNVLIGDMSLVGPRPILPSQVDEYQNFNLYVRLTPGITGLWQINGRNHTTFQRRTEFDTAYIRNWSPWLDLSILVRTVRVVLRCEGAY